MAGSTIFVMYADGNGNVTASVRDGGAGHVEPTLDSTMQAGLSLMEGSGIVGGNMVANIHCVPAYLHLDNCHADPRQAPHACSNPTKPPLLRIGSQHGQLEAQSTAPQHHIISNNILRRIRDSFSSISPRHPSRRIPIHLLATLLLLVPVALQVAPTQAPPSSAQVPRRS